MSVKSSNDKPGSKLRVHLGGYQGNFLIILVYKKVVCEV